jgi:hypothetical protein
MSLRGVKRRGNLAFSVIPGLSKQSEDPGKVGEQEPAGLPIQGSFFHPSLIMRHA